MVMIIVRNMPQWHFREKYSILRRLEEKNLILVVRYREKKPLYILSGGSIFSRLDEKKKT
jgi:hypothetical protein